jgi:hypothetical protein
MDTIDGSDDKNKKKDDEKPKKERKRKYKEGEGNGDCCSSSDDMNKKKEKQKKEKKGKHNEGGNDGNDGDGGFMSILNKYTGEFAKRAMKTESNSLMESLFSVNPAVTEGDKVAAHAPPSTLAPGPHIQLSKPILQKEGEKKEICVARFGKIYKRKATSNIGYLARKCSPGYRFCKLCNETLPVSAFHVNVKRYVCKRHHYMMVKKRKIIRHEKDPMVIKTS